MKRAPQGFTLIELMIVVSIIAIIASIAIPQYQDYVSRTRAHGAVAELADYRRAIAVCAADQESLAGCDASSNGIPGIAPAQFPPTRNVLAIASITDGVITATTGATASSGGANLIYRVVPTLGPTTLTWSAAGSTVCNASRGLRPGQGGC